MCIYCWHQVLTESHDQFDVKAMIYAFMIDKKIGQKNQPDDKPPLEQGCLLIVKILTDSYTKEEKKEVSNGNIYDRGNT